MMDEAIKLIQQTPYTPPVSQSPSAVQQPKSVDASLLNISSITTATQHAQVTSSI
jgi:hypothetical protein